jgi:hypothetical protein
VLSATPQLKTSSTILAVLLQSLSFNAQADEYFIGGDIAPIVSWADKCTLLVLGCSWSENTHGYGVRIGRWMRDGDAGIGGVGWELGYDDLGNISGSTSFCTQPGNILFCPGDTVNWKHEAKAVHAAALLGGRDTPFARIGLHRSTTKSTGTYVSGGGTFSGEASAWGVFLGAGFNYPTSRNLSLSAAADVFMSMKVTDPTNPASTRTAMPLRISAGLNYTF